MSVAFAAVFVSWLYKISVSHDVCLLKCLPRAVLSKPQTNPTWPIMPEVLCTPRGAARSARWWHRAPLALRFLLAQSLKVSRRRGMEPRCPSLGCTTHSTRMWHYRPLWAVLPCFSASPLSSGCSLPSLLLSLGWSRQKVPALARPWGSIL